jgi:hypothetical protein
MKTFLLVLVAVIAVMLCVVFISWCSGFNFDARNADVGFGVMMAMILSIFAGAAVIGIRNS